MSSESGKNAAPTAVLLSAINGASASFYATRPGYPFSGWNDLPILAGTDLAKEIDDHPPFGRLRIRDEPLLRAALATVPVPHAVPICWSAADLEREAQLGARVLSRAGLQARGRTSDCLEGGVVTPGTLAVTDALDAIDALALPVGPITNEASLARARDVWAIVQPRMLITTADTFAFLESRSDAPDVTHVLLLTPNESALLAAPARANVFRVLSLPIIGSFIASECIAHDGLHVADDAFVAEIVDERGQPLAADASGRLVLSTVQRNHAVVRLNTGLRAALDHVPCECDEPTPRLRIA